MEVKSKAFGGSTHLQTQLKSELAERGAGLVVNEAELLIRVGLSFIIWGKMLLTACNPAGIQVSGCSCRSVKGKRSRARFPLCLSPFKTRVIDPVQFVQKSQFAAYQQQQNVFSFSSLKMLGQSMCFSHWLCQTGSKKPQSSLSRVLPSQNRP